MGMVGKHRVQRERLLRRRIRPWNEDMLRTIYWRNTSVPLSLDFRTRIAIRAIYVEEAVLDFENRLRHCAGA